MDEHELHHMDLGELRSAFASESGLDKAEIGITLAAHMAELESSESALAFAYELLPLVLSLEDLFLEADLRELIADIHKDRREYPESAEQYGIAAELLIAIDRSEFAVITATNKSRSHLNANEFELAKDAAKTAISCLTDETPARDAASSYLCLARSLRMLQQFEEAELTLSTGRRFAEQLEECCLVVDCDKELVLTYAAYLSADEMVERCELMAELDALDGPRAHALGLLRLATARLDAGLSRTAEYAAMQGLELAAADDRPLMAHLWFQLTRIYVQTENDPIITQAVLEQAVEEGECIRPGALRELKHEVAIAIADLGALGDAEKLLLEILEPSPEHEEAVHLCLSTRIALAIICMQQGRPGDGLMIFDDPDHKWCDDYCSDDQGAVMARLGIQARLCLDLDLAATAMDFAIRGLEILDGLPSDYDDQYGDWLRTAHAVGLIAHQRPEAEQVAAQTQAMLAARDMEAELKILQTWLENPPYLLTNSQADGEPLDPWLAAP